MASLRQVQPQSNLPADKLAISTTGLTKRFGSRTVVDGLDLAIPSGVVCGFVGPNGAGKTTTLRMLLGLVRPTAGIGSILGGDLTRPDTYLPRVGALIESPAFYPQLTGRSNLIALARLGRVNLDTVEPLLDRVGLSDRSDDSFHSYSLGMKQRLGIAAALLADPQLLILDEPTNGLDPAGIAEMRGLVRSFVGEGITVVISSHLIAEVEQICDFLVIIRAGRLAHQGPTAELRRMEQPDLLVAPEFDEDTTRLGELLRQRGCMVEETTGASALMVIASSVEPAAINRAAAEAGITLRVLAESARGLEQAFFALTGVTSGDVHGENELGAIR